MVSLRHAYEQGSNRIELRCMRPTDRTPFFCGKSGEIKIEDAIKRWGGETQLEDIRVRCSRCGSNERVSKMGVPPGRPGKRGRR